MDTLRRELRAAGPGEALAAALLVSAFYLEPILGSAPWLASLVLTCLAGAVAIVVSPRLIRTLPLPLVAYVAVYALAGAYADLGGASDIGRYLGRPVAIGALALWMTRPGASRRVLVMSLAAIAPQLAIAAVQSAKAVIEHGRKATLAADSVTGSLGSSEANTLGMVAIAGACILAGLALTRLVTPRQALGGAAAMVGICILASTRAAVLLVPIAAIGLAAGAFLALRARAPVRPIVACLAIAAVSVPVIYGATAAIYPGAWLGAFSNQQSHRLNSIDQTVGATGAHGGPPTPVAVGVAVLPGRAKQIRLAARISDDDGVGVALLGRGYGSAAVLDQALPASAVSPPHRTGVTWLGKVITETGWLSAIALFALLGWLVWLGVGLIRHASSDWERALGFTMPAFVALTAGGTVYTTVLDVRAYSALFIVLAATTIAASQRRQTEPSDRADTDPGDLTTAPVGASA
jgi:hypothetical protein